MRHPQFGKITMCGRPPTHAPAYRLYYPRSRRQAL